MFHEKLRLEGVRGMSVILTSVHFHINYDENLIA